MREGRIEGGMGFHWLRPHPPSLSAGECYQLGATAPSGATGPPGGHWCCWGPLFLLGATGHIEGHWCCWVPAVRAWLRSCLGPLVLLGGPCALIDLSL